MQHHRRSVYPHSHTFIHTRVVRGLGGGPVGLVVHNLAQHNAKWQCSSPQTGNGRTPNFPRVPWAILDRKQRPQIEPKSTPNRPRPTPNRPQNKPQIDPPNRPPKSTPNRSQFDPKSTPQNIRDAAKAGFPHSKSCWARPGGRGREGGRNKTTTLLLTLEKPTLCT